MHTAEHLIGGAVVRMLGCGRAFTTHIERKKSKCDFRCERGLTPDELERIERTVNEQIASGADVRAEIVPVDEARKRYDLSRLPEGATEVRIVHIGSFDSCPCIGKHVSNTSEIPPVAIVSSDWADGVLRIRFKLAKLIGGRKACRNHRGEYIGERGDARGSPRRSHAAGSRGHAA